MELRIWTLKQGEQSRLSRWAQSHHKLLKVEEKGRRVWCNSKNGKRVEAWVQSDFVLSSLKTEEEGHKPRNEIITRGGSDLSWQPAGFNLCVTSVLQPQEQNSPKHLNDQRKGLSPRVSQYLDFSLIRNHVRLMTYRTLNTVQWCYFKPQSLWQFVTAPQHSVTPT